MQTVVQATPESIGIQRFCWLAGSFIFLLLIVIPGVHGSLPQAALSLLLLIAFLLTALPLTRFLFGNGVISVVLAFPVGFTLHAFFLGVIGVLVGINRLVLLIYMLAAFSTALIFRNNPARETKRWQSKDLLLLFVWVGVTLLSVSLPFFRVGIETPNGLAYRAYFNADFFRNMAVSASLANSGVPPINPYYAGYTLRYYWFFHLLLAYWKLLFNSFRPDFLLVQFSLVTVAIFSSTLFVICRKFVTCRKTLALLLPLFLFGGSYKGLYVLQRLHAEHKSWTGFTSWNIEGILRWFWNAPQIDMLYRALLFAPQHLIALSIFLLLLFNANETRAHRILLFILVFCTLGFSAFIGAVLIASCGVFILINFLRRPKDFLPDLLLYGAMGIVFAFLYLKSFGMFEAEPRQLKFGLNYIILGRLPLYLLLNWGALLVLGTAGIFRRSRGIPFGALLYFLLLCFGLILFVQLDLPGGSDVSLKVGYLVHLTLLLLAAGFIDSQNRKVVLAAILILLLPGFVTWMMDAYNSSDIKNRQFTTFVRKEDANAFGWMRHNLPPMAIVQDYPTSGGYLEDYVTEIPPLAERPVFVGDKNFARIFQIKRNFVDHRMGIVSKMFHERSAPRVNQSGRSYGVQFFFFSTKTNDETAELRSKLTEPYFTRIYEQGAAELYRLNDVESKPEDLEQNTLLEENGKRVLQAKFADNFYPPEIQSGVMTSRWLSNDAIILFSAATELKGKLELVSYALARNRRMQIYLNNRKLHETTVLPRRTVVSFQILIPQGESRLMIRAPEGAESAAKYTGEKDQRNLSFRLLPLKFIKE